MSRTTLKTNQSPSRYLNRREESKQKLLQEHDVSSDDDGLPWRIPTQAMMTDENNNDQPVSPARYLFRMLTSVGLCSSVIFIVFDSFKLLLAAAVFENILNIIMMVLSMLYMSKCPLNKMVSPALFAFAFTSLVKSLLSIWSNRESFGASSTTPSGTDLKSVFGKRLSCILLNGLQLMSLGFFIFSCFVVFPLYPAMVHDPQPEGLNSTRHCNKLLYWYSFSFLSLHFLYTIVFLVWIPCILLCLLRD